MSSSSKNTNKNAMIAVAAVALIALWGIGFYMLPKKEDVKGGTSSTDSSTNEKVSGESSTPAATTSNTSIKEGGDQKASDSTPSESSASATTTTCTSTKTAPPCTSTKNAPPCTSTKTAPPSTSPVVDSPEDIAYNAAVNVASKRVQGKQYDKALVKYTEAISFIPTSKIAAANKKQLFNNRSAMYEKLGKKQEGLDDIEIVLECDNKHLKARARKARILESLGESRWKEALMEYTLHAYMESMSDPHKQPQYTKAMEGITKKLATKMAGDSWNQIIQSKTSRALPDKHFNKGIFEKIPEYYEWKAQFEAKGLENFVSEYKNASTIDSLSAQLNLVCAAITQGKFETAFKYLNIDSSSGGDGDVANEALLLRLQGFELYLKNNLLSAKAKLAESLDKNPKSFATNFGMASLELELSQPTNALERLNQCILDCIDEVTTQQKDLSLLPEYISSTTTIFTAKHHHHHHHHQQQQQQTDSKKDSDKNEVEEEAKILTPEELQKLVTQCANNCDSNQILQLAFTFLHRSDVWVSRDAQNNVTAQFVPLGIQDVKIASMLFKCEMERDTGLEVYSRGYVLSCLKSIHILNQNTNGEHSPEDLATMTNFINSAKEVQPNSREVIIVDCEIHNMDGKLDEALSIVQKLKGITDARDAIPYVLEANMLAHKAMQPLRNEGSASAPSPEEQQRMMYEAQQMLAQACQLFDTAVEMDRTCVEALSQSSRLNLLLGNPKVALQNVRNALPHARSKDELYDLEHLKIEVECQKNTVEAIEKIYTQIAQASSI